LNEVISDGVNDGVSDGVNDGVKRELNKLLTILIEIPGMKASEIAAKIDKSKPTVERYIKILKRYNVIEFIGAPKTGGYHLTTNFKGKLAL